MEGEEGLEGLEKVFPRARMLACRGRARALCAATEGGGEDR